MKKNSILFALIIGVVMTFPIFFLNYNKKVEVNKNVSNVTQNYNKKA